MIRNLLQKFSLLNLGKTTSFNLNILKLSTSSILKTFELNEFEKDKSFFPKPKRWNNYNLIIRPPETGNEPYKRRAEYYYFRDNIKYSPKKMWYICCFMRGLSADEAVKQLSFITSKGAVLAKEALQEAVENALKNGFEYKSNMFISECFCSKGLVVKSIKKHAKRRFGKVSHFYLHLFIKLTEGEPPKPGNFYFNPHPKTGKDKLDKFIKDCEQRKIEYTI